MSRIVRTDSNGEKFLGDPPYPYRPMANKITVEVNDEWLDFLGEMSRNNDGFIWIKVERTNG